MEDKVFNLDRDSFERVQDRGHFDLNYKKVLDENKNTKLQDHLQKKTHEEIQLRESLNRIARCEDGIIFLRWLMNQLGYKESFLPMANGKVDLTLSIFKETKRVIWSDIRNLMSVPVRNTIEEDL